LGLRTRLEAGEILGEDVWCCSDEAVFGVSEDCDDLRGAGGA